MSDEKALNMHQRINAIIDKMKTKSMAFIKNLPSILRDLLIKIMRSKKIKFAVFGAMVILYYQRPHFDAISNNEQQILIQNEIQIVYQQNRQILSGDEFKAHIGDTKCHVKLIDVGIETTPEEGDGITQYVFTTDSKVNDVTGDQIPYVVRLEQMWNGNEIIDEVKLDFHGDQADAEKWQKKLDKSLISSLKNTFKATIGGDEKNFQICHDSGSIQTNDELIQFSLQDPETDINKEGTEITLSNVRRFDSNGAKVKGKSVILKNIKIQNVKELFPKLKGLAAEAHQYKDDIIGVNKITLEDRGDMAWQENFKKFRIVNTNTWKGIQLTNKVLIMFLPTTKVQDVEQKIELTDFVAWNPISKKEIKSKLELTFAGNTQREAAYKKLNGLLDDGIEDFQFNARIHNGKEHIVHHFNVWQNHQGLKYGNSVYAFSSKSEIKFVSATENPDGYIKIKHMMRGGDYDYTLKLYPHGYLKGYDDFGVNGRYIKDQLVLVHDIFKQHIKEDWFWAQCEECEYKNHQYIEILDHGIKPSANEEHEILFLKIEEKGDEFILENVVIDNKETGKVTLNVKGVDDGKKEEIKKKLEGAAGYFFKAKVHGQEEDTHFTLLDCVLKDIKKNIEYTFSHDDEPSQIKVNGKEIDIPQLKHDHGHKIEESYKISMEHTAQAQIWAKKFTECVPAVSEQDKVDFDGLTFKAKRTKGNEGNEELSWTDTLQFELTDAGIIQTDTDKEFKFSTDAKHKTKVTKVEGQDHDRGYIIKLSNMRDEDHGEISELKLALRSMILMMMDGTNISMNIRWRNWASCNLIRIQRMWNLNIRQMQSKKRRLH